MTTTTAKTAVRIPPPSVSLYVGGDFDRDRHEVVGGTFEETRSLPTDDAKPLFIGRDRDCSLRIPGAAVSRKAVRVERTNGRPEMWIRSASGGVVYLPGGRTIPIPVSSDETPSCRPEYVEIVSHTVVELVVGHYKKAHLVFDVPRAAVAPPPSLEGDTEAPPTEVEGQPRYDLSPADKEMLVAVCPDKVATPPFGIEMPSTPALAVRMLQSCASSYFEGKGPRETYDSDKLNPTIMSFARRVEQAEDLAHVPDDMRLMTLISAYKEGGHSGTLGVDEWLGRRPEVVAELDFDLAVAMRDVRDREIARMRCRQTTAGLRGAAEAARRRDAGGLPELEAGPESTP